MSESLERDHVIELLNALGSAQDEDALSAARALHLKITQARLSWDDLLVADNSENNELEEREEPFDEELEDEELEDEELEDEELEDEDGVEDNISKQSKSSADVNAVDADQTLTLIEKLLARKGNSVDLQEELEGYKLDIANGDFEISDHSYIKALYARLMKRRQK